MHLYRISRERYASHLIASGRAGRWNDDHQKVIYSSSSRALASLELLVHRSAIRPSFNYKVVVIEAQTGDGDIEKLQPDDLPENWRTLLAYPHLQKTGSQWYQKNSSLMLKVPSVIIPYEFNFIINTTHTDFLQKIRLLRLEDHFWDNRLI